MNGSIHYNGRKIVLNPGTQELGKGLVATLEYSKLTDCAEYAVLKLKNAGQENTWQIQWPKTLDLFTATEETPVYHGLAGDSCGAESFMPIDFELSRNWHEEPLGGRSSNTTGFPFFDISWGEETTAVAIGWTGQWSKDIRIGKGGFTLQIGLCDADFYLKPGEEIQLPSVLVVYGQGAAQTRRVFRNVIREHFTPKNRLGDQFVVPTSIQCFDRYYVGQGGTKKSDAWATEAGQIRTVDGAKKLEYIDTLWLDAAWFEKGFPHGVGNFRFSAGFPNGLKPVSDHAHASGMRFMLWFEPERVYEGSDLFDQTDKLLSWEEYPTTRMFNLSDPDALAWLEKTLIDMIRDNGIDVYRQDFNMEPLPYWHRNDEPGRRGMTEIKYVMGLYRLWDALLAEFPNLLIDNCSSGGRRLDLETAKRSITLWRSDTGCFPEDAERRVTVWSTNQILTLSEYLPYHACACWSTDAYDVRSNETHGMACNFDILNPEFEFERGIAVLREGREMRSYWDGDFYPLTKPTVDETVWCAYQLAFADKGAVYAFRREFCETDSMTFSLNAIDPAGEYKVEFVDENLQSSFASYSGTELLDGLEMKIGQKRGSLIVKYHKV